jgi:predicted PurR-regulated permease PerM
MTGSQFTKWTRAGVVVWTLLGGLVALMLLARVLAPLRPLLLVVFLALIIVVLLIPMVDWLERRRVPRGLGTALAFLASLTGFALIVRLIVPVLRRQFRDVADALPDLVAQLEPAARRLAEQLGFDLDFDLTNLSALLEDAQVTEFLMRSLGGLSGFAGSIITWIFLSVLAPVIAFYVLIDIQRIRKGVLRLVPRRRREQTVDFINDASGSFGSFVRGQIVVATFVGITTGLVLWIIGVPFAAVIGLIAGITDLIPFIGPFIGGALAVSVALATDGLGKAVIAAIAILVVQQLESHVISPLVLGKAVELRPLAVLIVVIIGGMVAGLPGLLIAVPLITVFRAGFRVFTANDEQTAPTAS